MTREQINRFQKIIDDFFYEAQCEAKIESEGYPHSPYVSQLGKSQEEFVHFIDEVNEHLGNPVELAPLLLDTLSFKQCMNNYKSNRISSMFKIIIGIMFIYLILTNDGISAYKDVVSLSDLGSLLNSYLATMTAFILLAFGADELLKEYNR